MRPTVTRAAAALALVGRANGVVLRSTDDGASFTVEPPITMTSSTQAAAGDNPAGIWDMTRKCRHLPAWLV